MGSWDVYCAICGGPTGCGIEISRKPRTARFKRRQARKAAKIVLDQVPKRGAPGKRKKYDSDSEDSLDSGDEDRCYDREILSIKDAKWTKIISVLWYYPEAPIEQNHAHKHGDLIREFLLENCYYADYGGIDENGADPGFEIETIPFACYCDYTGDSPVVFPFHPCCYELLSRRITGGTDISKLNKTVLWNIMKELSPEGSNRLNLDYGEPCPPNEQFWQSAAGEEIFAAKPTGDKKFEILVRATIMGRKFQLLTQDPGRDQAIDGRTGHDVFKMLPYDIVYHITELLPISAVLRLCQASWVMNTLLRDDMEFWRRRIKRELLPWFYELAPLIDGPGPSRAARLDLKKVVAWAEKVSEPRLGKSGPFLALANRRRVWGVCDQLAELYSERMS